MPVLDAPAAPVSADLDVLRGQIRSFLREAVVDGVFVPRCDGWHAGWDESFSRLLGKHGWVGITLPVAYGGAGLTPLHRHVVSEELVAAGAPVNAHWAADRQMGPALLEHGTAEQRDRFLPGIARGEVYFAIGMSEPDSGSDLASVRSRATKIEGGWRLSGTKLWVTGAHRAQAVLVLVRTRPLDETARHAGLSQLIVMADSPGVEIRPIHNLAGDHHFNEVSFDDVFVPDSMLFGAEGEGWAQVTSELGFERSGPERYLSTFPLLQHLARYARATGDPRHTSAVGGLIARLWTLRQMSYAVAVQLAQRRSAELPAALVKELGTRYEGDVVEIAREVLAIEPDPDSDDQGAVLLAQAIQSAPGFTIRGGTNEILQGLVAKGVGVR
ncbi:MAG TPA: acyl-CoA dehydrogenase [Nocardioides bacterium]|nr:acyl-CoA dehydrogenase [Nocardioides sp.]